MFNLFSKLATESTIKVAIYTILFSITFCIVLILVDKVRMFIFKVLKINKFTEKINIYTNKLFKVN